MTISVHGSRRPRLRKLVRAPGPDGAAAQRAVAVRVQRAVPGAALRGAAPVVPALVLLLAGCSSGPAPGAAGTSCGHTRTAVGVPVVIMVAKGTVDCATALRVEADYAAAIKAGDLQGNGGGAPVAVDGWTCESYPTQEVLRTGNASECHNASTSVLAVLSLPSASTGSSASAGS
ncbi:MAG TPA: hypothetical protein VF838_13500 [Trebonia sp.]